MQKTLEKEKDIKNMSKIQQLSLDYYKQLHQRKLENNYPSISRMMVEFYMLTASLEGRTEPNLIETRENIIKEIDEIIEGFDSYQLIQFAYCIR